MAERLKYFLGIDFGGGASKATLLAGDGNVAATHTTEYKTSYPAPGYAEQDPEDWINATVTNIKGVLEKSGISPSDIAAVSLDAATHTAVIMDENFRVIRPAVYWTDTRSTGEVRWLKENLGELIEKQVLHKPDTIWTLPELMWVKNNEPENWSRVRKILFAKDFVRHRLTGDYVTDRIEAEGSMMYDAGRRCWSPELCGILDIPTGMMPKIVEPTDIVGAITHDAAALTGLSTGTPVVCGTTDTVMEVFASGAVSKGQMTLKLATAGRICVITDKPYPNPNLINYSHIADGLYYPGTATKSCASAYRWFRDAFGGDYAELDYAAESLPIGSCGLMFHPYLNGELTPYANPKLCASFIGVRSMHEKAHFARAVLEGVAMSMLDCMNAIENIGIPHADSAFIIGGGGKSPLWRQMISDALGIKLIGMKHSDSSLGTAMLAGIAVGHFASPEEAVKACNSAVFEVTPNSDNTEKYRRLFKKYKAVQAALEPIYNNEDL